MKIVLKIIKKILYIKEPFLIYLYIKNNIFNYQKFQYLNVKILIKWAPKLIHPLST